MFASLTGKKVGPIGRIQHDVRCLPWSQPQREDTNPRDRDTAWRILHTPMPFMMSLVLVAVRPAASRMISSRQQWLPSGARVVVVLFACQTPTSAQHHFNPLSYCDCRVPDASCQALVGGTQISQAAQNQLGHPRHQQQQQQYHAGAHHQLSPLSAAEGTNNRPDLLPTAAGVAGAAPR